MIKGKEKILHWWEREHEFRHIGTDKIRIGICKKTGSSALRQTMEQSKKIWYWTSFITLKQLHDGGFRSPVSKKHEKIDMMIIPVRHPLEKWASGYYQDLIDTHVFHNTISSGNNNSNFREIMEDLHDISKDYNLQWLNGNNLGELHTNYDWGNDGRIDGMPMRFEHMMEYASAFDNVYFVRMKDLKHPDFLKFLQEKDPTWDEVKEIYVVNEKASAKTRVNQIEEYWKEIYYGGIKSEKVLFSPELVKVLWIDLVKRRDDAPKEVYKFVNKCLGSNDSVRLEHAVRQYDKITRSDRMLTFGESEDYEPF